MKQNSRTSRLNTAIRNLMIGGLGACLASASLAADTNGRFAAKGAAQADCSLYAEAVDQKTGDRLLFAGWLEGYISGYNQLQQDTYDIAPWQTTDLLLSLLYQHCQKHPEQKFLHAASSMLNSLSAQRLEVESEVVKISVGEVDTYHRKAILERAREKLQELGYYKNSVPSGEFGEQDIEAFTAYQTEKGLKTTGFPDQYTLTQMFLLSQQP